MPSRLLIPVSALLFVGVALLAGCSEKEVPYVIDDEEILRYLNESADAKELFRTDGLFGTEEYSVAGDTTVYKILVDSVKRRISLNSHVDTVRKFEAGGTVEFYRLRHVYPTLGEIPGDCEATIDDIYYVRNLRIAGTDTTVTRSARAVNRFGYLLKLGSDYQSYRGWKLWAYSGGTSSGSMVVKSSGFVEFRGDGADMAQMTYTVIRESLTYGSTSTGNGASLNKFRRLDQIGNVAKGAPLYLDCYNSQSSSFARLVTADVQSGPRQRSMTPTGTLKYVDTLHTPSNNPRLWNLLFMQDYQRTLIPGSIPPEYTYNWVGWCVPYRVQQ